MGKFIKVRLCSDYMCLPSEVSTSSGWSFSSQGENEDSVRGPGASLGLGLETAEERSRRLSKLPPAEVSDTELVRLPETDLYR